MAHETDEDLSALIDGELPARDMDRARAHAGSCPDCAARLAKLELASAAFKRSGEAAVPAGVLPESRHIARRDVQNPTLKFLVVMAVAVLLVLVSGMAMKRLLPGMFSQIQGMISGAAGQMGTGGK